MSGQSKGRACSLTVDAMCIGGEVSDEVSKKKEKGGNFISTLFGSSKANKIKQTNKQRTNKKKNLTERKKVFQKLILKNAMRTLHFIFRVPLKATKKDDQT